MDMRGQTVIARAFQGVPLARRVWDIGERVIYLTNDEGLEKLASGHSAPPPIGFPVEDVFRFDEALFKRLESAMRRQEKAQLARIWSDAKPYIEQS
jgi:hypothetical protein